MPQIEVRFREKSGASESRPEVGRDEDGELLVCHCSAAENCVVVSGCEVGGFVRFGRIKEDPTSE